MKTSLDTTLTEVRRTMDIEAKEHLLQLTYHRTSG
jgi:hypothetical protein